MTSKQDLDIGTTGDKESSNRAILGAFGPRAGAYAVSVLHIKDISLDVMKRLAAGPESSQRRWAIDVATGAGFTAFAMSEFAQTAVATDPARPTLQEARCLSQDRGLKNLMVCQSSAEALPFADGSLDLVSCRLAAHHFLDFHGALGEVVRVLKVGGVLIMADGIAPEDDVVAEWMNEVELRRDFSHVEGRMASHIERIVVSNGLGIMEREYTRIDLGFNSWVARTNTSQAESESLWDDFLNAPAAVREAFQIRRIDDDIHFSWPCLIFKAVKK